MICTGQSLNYLAHVAFIFNGRFYKPLNYPVQHFVALAQASQLTYNGLVGYLATILQNAEAGFAIKIFEDTWTAASDSTVEGTWHITAGPDSGQTPPMLWNDGQPDGEFLENCARLSLWWALDDVACSQLYPAVVEFECNVSSLTTNVSSCDRMICSCI